MSFTPPPLTASLLSFFKHIFYSNRLFQHIASSGVATHVDNLESTMLARLMNHSQQRSPNRPRLRTQVL